MTKSDDTWTLITNHGAVLMYIAQHPDHTVREIADSAGVTERSAARIIRDLRNAGFISARRVGRRNEYQIDPTHELRHPVGEHKSVADLLRGLATLRAPTIAEG